MTEIETDDPAKKRHHLDQYNYVNELMREDTESALVKAANWCKDIAGQAGRISEPKSAKVYVNTLWRSLLENDMYLEAAAMNWGYMKFDGRPQLLRDIFEFLPTYNKMAIVGASSVSKSYGCLGYFYLDYQRDPQYTGVKLVTISGDKLESLLFSPLSDLHASSVMEVTGKVGRFKLTHNDDNVNVGFQGILIPQDQQGTGKLKGVKYFRRNKKHPIFGWMTRTRVFVDEFQDTSSGIIKDLDSPLSQISGPHPMKIALSGNPTDYAINEALGQVTEPKDGWSNFDIENDHKWVSKKGWNVLRLDGARSENVMYQQDIYYGMQTHEFFNAKASDPTDAGYYTFARGCFPLEGTTNTLISLGVLDRALGRALFHEGATPVAAVDVGLRHDKAIFALGMVGMATGWVNPEGDRKMFVHGTRDTENAPQLIMQVDQIIELKDFNGDVIQLSKKVEEKAKEFGVDPKHIAVDSTGMGEGVASWLSNYFGSVLPVYNGEKASEFKILKEDKKLPVDSYSKIADELWFGTSKWLSVNAIMVNPQIDKKTLEQLWSEWSTRNRGRKRGGKETVESKDEWKIRNQGKSPDYADAVNMLQQVVRARLNLIPAMEKSKEVTRKREKFNPPNADYVDSLKYNGLTSRQENSKPRPFDINQLRRSFVVGQQ